MSNSEIDYISSTMACMRGSHLRMVMFDLKFLGPEGYDIDNTNYEPYKIIIKMKQLYLWPNVIKMQLVIEMLPGYLAM